MGASSSKATGACFSLNRIFDKTANLYTIARAETVSAGHKDRKCVLRKRSKRVTKDIISSPLEFTHLNHAGLDYDSLNFTYIPIEQARRKYSTMTSVSGVQNKSYRIAIRQKRDDIDESSCFWEKSLSVNTATIRHSKYGAIFSKDLQIVS